MIEKYYNAPRGYVKMPCEHFQLSLQFLSPFVLIGGYGGFYNSDGYGGNYNSQGVDWWGN